MSKYLDWQHKSILVLSGGGFKGIAMLGLLYKLYKHGLLKDIKTIAGSSIGAIIGFLISIGYSPKKIYKIIKNINFTDVMTINQRNLFKTGGINDGSDIINLLKDSMNSLELSPDLTFGELYEKKNIKLIITGTCLNTNSVEYFSMDKGDSNMRILDAVRISMSFPFVFTPVEYNGKLYIDGGCMDNFPIDIFTAEERMEKMIGIHLKNYIEKKIIINTIEDYCLSIINCLIFKFNDIKNKNKYLIDLELKTNIIPTHVLTKEEMKNMFKNGFNYKLIF